MVSDGHFCSSAVPWTARFHTVPIFSNIKIVPGIGCQRYAVFSSLLFSFLHSQQRKVGILRLQFILILVSTPVRGPKSTSVSPVPLRKATDPFSSKVQSPYLNQLRLISLRGQIRNQFCQSLTHFQLALELIGLAL